MALTLEVLAKVAAQGRGGGAGDALAQLVEQAKRSSPLPKSSASLSGEEAKEYGLVDDVIQRPGVTLPPRDLKDIVEKGMENPYAMSIYDAAEAADK